MTHDGLYVVEQGVRSVNLRNHRLHQQQLLRGQRRREGCEQVAAILSSQQLPLQSLVGITELDAHQEAIELRFRQWIRTYLVNGILRRDHEERRCERVALSGG